jgi:hypothetical protein
VNPEQGLAFVELHGIVLQAARGPVPNLVEAIAGEAIRGSWWAHPKGRQIFRVSEAIGASPDVLVCKLLDGKVTYVHRRLWPALVKSAALFREGQLDRVWSEHTPTGAHRSRRIAFPEWVPGDVVQQSQRLSPADAQRILAPWPMLRREAKEDGR